MGIMTNRSTLTGKLLVLLVAVLAAFQPGFAETQDIEEIRKAVEQGHAEAQYRLGLMYSFGQGAPQDSREAAKLIRKAAEQGHAEAQFILGFMYSTGDGVPQDSREAAKLIRKVAEQGYALAQFSLGLKYDKGDGVPEDDREAVKWYQLAAEQGYVCAQFTLGLKYDKGVGVPENDVEAMKWYRKAAEQGDAEAQFNLGYMYANGEGVGRDYVKAYIWANLAAAQGGDKVVKPKEMGGGESIKFKDWLRKKMTAEQVAEAQKLSVERFNRIESSALDLLRRDCSSIQSDRLPASPIPGGRVAWKVRQEAERVSEENDVTTTLPEPSGIHFVSKEVTPPTVLSRVEPVYSKKARKAKLQGSVMLSVIVRKDGTLEVLKVVRELGLGLDENAIKALKSWRFRPGMKDGRPVDVPLNIEVKFSLRQRH